MSVVDGRTWMELLSGETCWRLLAGQSVGRLAYLLAGEPEIVPVNYAVDGRCIVFRTDPGTKLGALNRNDVVAFEIDHAEPSSYTGWSVLVKGRAQQVHDGAELRRLAGLDLRPWPLGEKHVWMRIEPEVVSGRQVHRRPEPAAEDAAEDAAEGAV
jgi:nitroimidazol reductase NimA-like FMN-containing flavoprotein (pyridoxamine 5'-phosphate oxidase superfamily)